MQTMRLSVKVIRLVSVATFVMISGARLDSVFIVKLRAVFFLENDRIFLEFKCGTCMALSSNMI